MTPVVLDASAAANFLLPDESNTYGEKVLQYLERFGGVVPTLWDYEIGNVLTMALRRKRIDRRFRDVAVSLLLDLPLTYWNRGGAGALLHAPQICDLAERLSLSFYAASYLYVAKVEDLPLATLDTGLRTAARRSKVTVFAGD